LAYAFVRLTITSVKVFYLCLPNTAFGLARRSTATVSRRCGSHPFRGSVRPTENGFKGNIYIRLALRKTSKRI